MRALLVALPELAVGSNGDGTDIADNCSAAPVVPLVAGELDTLVGDAALEQQRVARDLRLTLGRLRVAWTGPARAVAVSAALPETRARTRAFVGTASGGHQLVRTVTELGTSAMSLNASSLREVAGACEWATALTDTFGDAPLPPTDRTTLETALAALDGAITELGDALSLIYAPGRPS